MSRDRSARPSLSVVIASRDRPAFLRACLESISECRCAPQEVIVVDSASQDPQATERVAQEFGACFIRTEIPGAGLARKLGAVAACGEIVAFTDDDAVVDSRWIDTLIETFTDSTVDASVGPVFIKGSTPPATMAVSPRLTRRRMPCVLPVRVRNGNRLAFGSIGYGANLAVRRTTFLRHGLFRTGLGAGAPIPGDENYFLFSLVVQGGSVVNQPLAWVTHPEQRPERIRELRRAAAAYVLYLLRAQPRLSGKIIGHLMRRLLTRRDDVGGTTRRSRWSVRELAGVAFVGPRLLLAAWRIERRLAR